MKSFAAKISIFVLLFGLIGTVPVAHAASITSSKDTLTRLKEGTNADHTVVFTLPATFNFDSTTQTDMLRVDFPHSSAFTQTGTWVTGDFTFNDGTARTVEAVAQGSGTVTCTVADGVNNVCVAIDTTNHIFSIKPSATYTASGAAATVTFTIDGTTTGGELINPAAAASYSVTIAECDEVAACTTAFTSTHTSTIGLSIVDDDQVTVTASVDPTLTFDIDTATTDSNTDDPYSVALGAITTANSKVSGTTDSVNSIYLEISTNASAGVVVTVQNANGTSGLVSGTDNINSATATQANGTENYGLCVATSGLTGVTAAGSYSGLTCARDSETNQVVALSTGVASIVSSSVATNAAQAEVIVNAAISSTTAAHSDYSDTLTFIATATY